MPSPTNVDATISSRAEIVQLSQRDNDGVDVTTDIGGYVRSPGETELGGDVTITDRIVLISAFECDRRAVDIWSIARGDRLVRHGTDGRVQSAGVMREGGADLYVKVIVRGLA